MTPEEKIKLDTGGGCSVCGGLPAVNVDGTYWLCGPCVLEKIEEPKWIDINEQRPENGQKVLVTDGEFVTAAQAYIRFHGDMRDERAPGGMTWCGCECAGYEFEWDYDMDSITYWAPLPGPP